MPYTTVVTSDVLTASFINANYRDQVISTVTSGTRPTGTEGQVIYETDTGRFLAHTGAGWEVISQLGAGNSFTPTLTQNGSVTFTNTRSRFNYLGHNVIRVEHLLTVTGSGTGNNRIEVSTPVTLATSTIGTPLGVARITDANVAAYNALVIYINSTAIAFSRTDALSSSSVGQDPNFALASTDSIACTYTAEIA